LQAFGRLLICLKFEATGLRNYDSPFDIFLVESDGHLMWKAAAETLDFARIRIKTLIDARPGNYVIYSQQTGTEGQS